jgi:hypothetical protein
LRFYMALQKVKKYSINLLLILSQVFSLSESQLSL